MLVDLDRALRRTLGSMSSATSDDGRGLDARSWVCLVVFFAVNILVVFPLRIPLPLPRRVSPAHSQSSGTSSTQPDPDSQHEADSPRQQVVARQPRRVLHIPLDLRTAPVAGVLLLLASTCIPGEVVRAGIVGSDGVRPYDVMTLFICFAYISLSLDQTGLLRYLAFLLSSRFPRSSAARLFSAFYFFFLTLGILTGNDPLILSGTPFLAYFTAHAGIPDPTAFLSSHFQVANLASALLVSSNPTNLVLTSAFRISFLRYSAWMALPTVGAGVVLFPLLRWGMFGGKGKGREEMMPERIDPPEVNPREALKDPWGGAVGAGVFLVIIVLLVGLSAGGKLEGTVGVWTVVVPGTALVVVRDVVVDLARRHRASHAPAEIAEKKTSAQDSDAAPTPTSHPPSPPSSGMPAPTVEKPSGASAPPPPEPTPSSRLARPFSAVRTRFPTTTSIIPRLPLALVPFAFSFFILVEGLAHTGWVRVFAGWWGAWADVGGVAGVVWLMGVLGVLGCCILGTNIGATVLLSRVLQDWQARGNDVTDRKLYGAVFALAVASNFGAYSFVFSASLAGLLWRNILAQKGITVKLRQFVKCNALPLLVTMIVGCLIVAGEVCVIH